MAFYAYIYIYISMEMQKQVKKNLDQKYQSEDNSCLIFAFTLLISLAAVNYKRHKETMAAPNYFVVFESKESEMYSSWSKVSKHDNIEGQHYRRFPTWRKAFVVFSVYKEPRTS